MNNRHAHKRSYSLPAPARIAFVLACYLLLNSAGFQPARLVWADERPDIVMGTPSSDIFHYYDPETESEVWGVYTTPKEETNPDLYPIIISPEITGPWLPGQEVNPGKPRPPHPPGHGGRPPRPRPHGNVNPSSPFSPLLAPGVAP